MYRTIKALHTRDSDLPERAWTLRVRHSVLDGTFYDVLATDFHQERDGSGEYIQMAARAPSVRHGLCRTVVKDSVALVFSEGHFPAFSCEDAPTKDAIEALCKQAKVRSAMELAATWGSVGSVAILLQVLDERLYLKTMKTTYLTPTFNPRRPGELLRVVERYKVKGAELRSRGYAVPEDDANADYWFQRVWDNQAEIWYLPRKVLSEDRSPLQVDAQRSVKHGLGFCPIVWIKNLAGGDDIDGVCTFDPFGIDNQIEMDYQLSQAGRGLKYSSSPTLVIKDDDTKRKHSSHVVGDALVVPLTGDARHLEINGQAVAAVIAYCEGVRKMTLEALGGSRIDPDRIAAAQSGRAMEILNQNLIGLAACLRTTYGEEGLLQIIGMARRINGIIPLRDDEGDPVGAMNPSADITLKWPSWYPPTFTDQAQQATAVTTLKDGGVISTRTAIAAVAPVYDIADPEQEQGEVERESQERADRDMQQAQAAKPPPKKVA